MCEVLADRRWSNPAGGPVTSETPARILRTVGTGCVIMITKYVGALLQQEIGEEVHDLCYIDLLVDSSWGAGATQQITSNRKRWKGFKIPDLLIMNELPQRKGANWHVCFSCRSMLMFTYLCTCAPLHRSMFCACMCVCVHAVWKRGVEAMEVMTDSGLTSHFTSLNRLNSSPRFLPFPGLPGAQCALVSVIKIDDLKWQRHDFCPQPKASEDSVTARRGSVPLLHVGFTFLKGSQRNIPDL